MFSDKDIRDAMLQRSTNSTEGILIEPFEEKYLTPVGYDLRVGDQGFSWKGKRIIEIQKEGRICIEPHDTVVIRTLEDVRVSKKIAATIHSMVSCAVEQGLSHVSTMIDPGWDGKLLISFHNYRDISIEIGFGSPLCTVCFYEVKSPADKDIRRPSDRDDIWQKLLEKAKEERDKNAYEMKLQTKRKNTETKIRIALIVGFILIASFSGIKISFLDPSLGASLAAFLAVISPFVLEILKPR